MRQQTRFSDAGKGPEVYLLLPAAHNSSRRSYLPGQMLPPGHASLKWPPPPTAFGWLSANVSDPRGSLHPARRVVHPARAHLGPLPRRVLMPHAAAGRQKADAAFCRPNLRALLIPVAHLFLVDDPFWELSEFADQTQYFLQRSYIQTMHNSEIQSRCC